MKHRVKLTVIDKKLYPELQRQYCADPNAGACPCYNIGDEFIFERDGDRDDFWHMGLSTLVKTSADPDTVAGGTMSAGRIYDHVKKRFYVRVMFTTFTKIICRIEFGNPQGYEAEIKARMDKDWNADLWEDD